MSMNLDLSIVVAVAENGTIGQDGRMPWHYPEDLQHFKSTTMGHPVIVGRRTFESIADRIGGPLPGRTNIVLSRSDRSFPDNTIHAQSLTEAFEIAADHDDRAFVIGGASIYEQALPAVDELIVTVIHEPYPGDTRFPLWPIDDPWIEVDREDRDDLSFVRYRRSDSHESSVS